MNAREIKEALALRAEHVAAYLVPGGKRDGHNWRAGSIHGEPGQSFAVCISGEKAGIWCDFNGGETGDLLDLWMQARRVSFVQALDEARDYLGVAPSPTFHAARAKTYRRPEKPHCRKPETSLSYLTGVRKLLPDTIAAYRLAEDGERILFPQLRDGEFINVKYLVPRKAEGEKNRWSQEKDCEPCLFGWQAIQPDDRSVVLTEGEIDALTVYQAGFPALSLPSGAKNLEWIATEFERLERFEEIVLCLDQDEAGKGATQAILERLGAERCRVATLPLKDANAMLQDGRMAELQEAIRSAGWQDPEELRNAADFMAGVLQMFHGGIEVTGKKLPYEDTHAKFGVRPGELTIWTGINGHGKSQLLGDVLVGQIAQGERICIFSGEMMPDRLLQRLVRQATGMRRPPNDLIEAAVKWLGRSLWIFNVTGTAKAERMLEVFAYARKRYGVTQFVIDSLLKCGFDEDGYNDQKHFVEALCDFNKKHQCHVHLVAHQRKTSDESRSGGKMGVRGAGAITDLAENVFEVWREKDKSSWEREKPDGKLSCFKQRNGEWEGDIELWFNGDAFQYRCTPDGPVRTYVDMTTNTADQTEYVEW